MNWESQLICTVNTILWSVSRTALALMWVSFLCQSLSFGTFVCNTSSSIQCITSTLWFDGARTHTHTLMIPYEILYFRNYFAFMSFYLRYEANWQVLIFSVQRCGSDLFSVWIFDIIFMGIFDIFSLNLWLTVHLWFEIRLHGNMAHSKDQMFTFNSSDCVERTLNFVDRLKRIFSIKLKLEGSVVENAKNTWNANTYVSVRFCVKRT